MSELIEQIHQTEISAQPWLMEKIQTEGTMMKSENMETLKKIPIFGGLDTETISLILDKSNLINKNNGGYFFRENDLADRMYVIRSGRVEVTRNWNNRTYHIKQMGRSECFGEMAIVDHFTRSANVRAISEVDAIEIKIDVINEIYEFDIKQFAILQMNLAKEVSHRLREVNDLLFIANVENDKKDIFFHPL